MSWPVDLVYFARAGPAWPGKPHYSRRARTTRGKPTIPLAASSSTQSFPTPQEDPPWGFLWDYPNPKPGVTPKKPGLRFRSLLTVINVVHYATFVTQLGLAYVLYKTSTLPPSNNLPRVQGSWFLVIMAPIFQAFAGYSPILAHEYEGWQVARFKDPANVKAENNELLRRVFYRGLFFWQGVGMGMGALGIIGPAGSMPAWAPSLQKRVIIGILIMYLWPRNNLFFPTVVSILNWVFYWVFRPIWKLITTIPGVSLVVKVVVSIFQWVVGLLTAWSPCLEWIKDVPKAWETWLSAWLADKMPTPIGVMVVFIMAASIYASALISFWGDKKFATVTVLVSACGGLVEGLITESTFNQWTHLIAVSALNLSGWLQIKRLSKLGVVDQCWAAFFVKVFFGLLVISVAMSLMTWLISRKIQIESQAHDLAEKP